MARLVKVSLIPREKEEAVRGLCEECGCEFKGMAAVPVGSGSLSHVSVKVKVSGELEDVRRLFDRIEGGK